MHRSYVQHVAGIRSLNSKLLDAQLSSMEACLAAELPPQCSLCGGHHMQLSASASVLYVGVEVRFELKVPIYHCSSVACKGAFAPDAFTVGCFPATPKASWDVTQSGPAQPARWFDLRLLQLCDSLIYGGGRSAAVHSLAVAIHRQHALNGSTAPLAWDHFRRQLGEAIMVSRRRLAHGPAGCKT